MDEIRPRSRLERRAAALEHLRSNSNLWFATASDGRGPHLIPVSYWWDGNRLTTAMFENSRTLKNVRSQPKVRVAIGSTGDVLMIDSTATIVSVTEIDPGAAEAYARAAGMTQDRCRVSLTSNWLRSGCRRGGDPRSFAGRTVMHRGVWLDRPID
jgi:hypothetical protein